MTTAPRQTVMHPTLNQSRINALDVIRGIALLGILLMNINGMGLPFSYEDPSVLGHTEGLNYGVWYANEMFFEGTMRGLFTILFGAGVILLTTRLINKGAGISTADVYYRRIVWFLLFVLINSWVFLWSGDILYAYALFGFFLFPFWNLRIRNLLVIAGMLISPGVIWNVSDYHQAKQVKKEADQAMNSKLFQTFIAIGIFHGIGLGYTGHFGFSIVVCIALVIFAWQVLFSTVWLRYFRFGPMEWIWRQMTYGRWIDIRQKHANVLRKVELKTVKP